MTDKRTRVTQGIVLLSVLTGLNGTASATDVTSGWHLSAGTVINFREIELHVKGKPLSVYEVVYSLHPMNDPGYSLPIGLWIYNFIEVGQSGHAENCKKWFNQVAHDESGTHELPYPYLEFDTLIGSTPIVSDEGALVIPDESVNCWEVMDFRLPV